jgi:hypothetical protein
MHFVDVTKRVVFPLNSSQWAGGPHHNKKDHIAVKSVSTQLLPLYLLRINSNNKLAAKKTKQNCWAVIDAPTHTHIWRGKRFAI